MSTIKFHCPVDCVRCSTATTGSRSEPPADGECTMEDRIIELEALLGISLDFENDTNICLCPFYLTFAECKEEFTKSEEFAIMVMTPYDLPESFDESELDFEDES